MSTQIASPHFLYIGPDELERARRRVHDPAWQEAAAALKKDAERALSRQRDWPVFDCAWYDADPDRDFGQTYVQWHDYIRPATALMSDAHALLIAGMVFQNEAYLDASQMRALHLAEHARFHVQHHDAGMGYAAIADSLAEIYRVIGNRCASAERDRLQSALAACGEAIHKNHLHWRANLARMPYNNHLACHMRGLLVAGLALDRADYIQLVLDSPKGFGHFLAGATYDDGLCYESSTGYHFATLNFLVRIAELVRHCPGLGRDLYREPCAGGRTLKDMFDAPLGLLFPNGELPALGDCYAHRDPLWKRADALYELAYAVYADPRYAGLLRSGRTSRNALLHGVDTLPEGEPLTSQSRLWIEHGYGLIVHPARPIAAVLTGDRSGVHNHRDTLSLQIFAGNHLWTEDVESRAVEAHGFSAPIQKAFNRTMLAHNLVVVDETDQRSLSFPLQIAAFSTLPSCHAVAMRDDAGKLYPGVRMHRHVSVTADYGLDVYQVASEDIHTYDYLIHPRSNGPAACDLTFEPAALPEREPYAVLSEPASAPISADGTTLSWSQETATFRFCVTAGAPGSLIRAHWPVASDGSEGVREMFMFRVRGARADFVALGQLTSDIPYRIASVQRQYNGAHDEIHIVLTHGETTCLHIVPGI